MPKKTKEEELPIPEETEEQTESIRATPDVETNFRSLMEDYGVAGKAATTITKYISETGTDRVFEKPMELLNKLASFPRHVPPVTRKTILDHWISLNKIPIPEGYSEEAEKPAEEIRQKGTRGQEIEAKFSVDPASGNIRVATTTDKTALTWDEAEKLSKSIEAKAEEQQKRIADRAERKVTYVYDTESRQVRMARAEEVGGTLEEAKELKRMAEADKEKKEEPGWIMDAEGNWAPNPQVPHTYIEMMAFEAIKKSRDSGQPMDPMEAMAQTMERMKMYQDVFGGQKNIPEWMTDPLKFIETVRAVSGGEKGDEGVHKELAEVRQALREMQDQSQRQEMSGLRSLIDSLNRKIDDQNEFIADLKRPVTGRTELDLLHDIAEDAIGLAKQELPGLRRDVREALTGGRLPPPKSPQEREEQKSRLRGVLEEDREIEELGRDIFSQSGLQQS